jgi:hypothetical protein|tara:strand:+ start:2967 stop:3161 length:195 start_codon:yes stop_codon:yes gene_type:complete
LYHAYYCTGIAGIRLRENLCLKISKFSASARNTLPILEGLLWALCRGDEESVSGKVYKRIVYGE